MPSYFFPSAQRALAELLTFALGFLTFTFVLILFAGLLFGSYWICLSIVQRLLK